MGRKRQSKDLVVSMNGREVGILTRVRPGLLQFQYEATWLNAGDVPPISLSMPLSPDPYSGERVWNYFDNLLPDNPDVRDRVQRSVGAESTRPFDLLAALGRDCIGALQLSEPPAPEHVRQIQATAVSDAWVAERLRKYRTHPLGLARGEEFRISLAGAQEKTALLWHEDAWHVPSGSTPTTHILKLPIGPVQHGIDLSDSVENEWLCFQVAAGFGLPVPSATILEFDDSKALAVERFDRRWSAEGTWLVRLPQEDACQALGLPPGRKYESDGGPGMADILELLLQSSEPAEDRRVFFRALVVYWMLAAIDGHAKNFSLFLHAGGRCRLTPLYDILSAHPIVASKQLTVHELRMAMAVDGKNRHYAWQEIQRRHWVSSARRARFSASEANAVLEECAALAPSVVEQVGNALPPEFPERIAQPILRGVAATAEKL